MSYQLGSISVHYLDTYTYTVRHETDTLSAKTEALPRKTTTTHNHQINTTQSDARIT